MIFGTQAQQFHRPAIALEVRFAPRHDPAGKVTEDTAGAQTIRDMRAREAKQLDVGLSDAELQRSARTLRALRSALETRR